MEKRTADIPDTRACRAAIFARSVAKRKKTRCFLLHPPFSRPHPFAFDDRLVEDMPRKTSAAEKRCARLCCRIKKARASLVLVGNRKRQKVCHRVPHALSIGQAFAKADVAAALAVDARRRPAF